MVIHPINPTDIITTIRIDHVVSPRALFPAWANVFRLMMKKSRGSFSVEPPIVCSREAHRKAVRIPVEAVDLGILTGYKLWAVVTWGDLIIIAIVWQVAYVSTIPD
jgi:hypothetical protein